MIYRVDARIADALRRVKLGAATADDAAVLAVVIAWLFTCIERSGRGDGIMLAAFGEREFAHVAEIEEELKALVSVDFREMMIEGVAH